MAIAALARWRRWLGGLLLVWVLVPSPWALEFLWAPTNAQAFDQWWQDAREALPETDGARCLVALAMSDPPRDIAIRAYPTAELASRSGRLEVYGISTFLEAPGQVLERGCEAVYLEGPQCSARFFGWGEDAPAEVERHPACDELARRVRLEPLLVEDVVNAGNADFPFYGRSPRIRFGLYRISGMIGTGQARNRPPE